MYKKHVKIPRTTTEPIKFKNEKDLEARLVKITKVLENATDANWSVSVAALKELQGLSLGGASKEPIYAILMQNIKHPYCNVLHSSRSTVVKEACVTLAVMAEAMV